MCIKYKNSMISLIIIAVFNFLNCNINESLTNILNLKLLDTSVTEIFLKIEINTAFQNADLIIYKDGKFFENKRVLKNEVIVVDSNLTANTKYSYEAELRIDQNEPIKSNKIFAQTLTPTSHEFVWQKFFWSEIGSNIEDIEIIDKKNIWAVGSIWVTDSTQNLHFYNGLFWNGERWELKEIPARVSPENNELVIGLVRSLFISDSNDIWFHSGGQMIHWNGNIYGDWTFLFESLSDTSFHGINKLGGISNKTGLAVGNKGNLFLSQKNFGWGKWEKLETNISEDFLDVLCIDKQENNSYLPATNFQDFNKNRILIIDQNKKITSIKSVITRWVSSLWTNNGFPIYLSGDGIFENKNETWREINYGANKVIERIRGNTLNDIFAVGHFGTVTHFNGIDWRIYSELEMNGIYKSLSVKENIIAIAGIEMGRAVIVLGVRR